MKSRIIAALLRLYPKAWRKEYGPELVDSLCWHPVTSPPRFMNTDLR